MPEPDGDDRRPDGDPLPDPLPSIEQPDKAELRDFVVAREAFDAELQDERRKRREAWTKDLDEGAGRD